MVTVFARNKLKKTDFKSLSANNLYMLHFTSPAISEFVTVKKTIFHNNINIFFKNYY